MNPNWIGKTILVLLCLCSISFIAAQNSGNCSNVGLFSSGVTAHVNIPPTSTINFGTAQNFTIELWVKIAIIQTNTVNVDEFIILEKRADTVYPYSIRCIKSTGKIAVTRYDGTSTATVSSTSNLMDDQWHHIAFVKEGSLLHLYIDGVLQGTANDTVVNPVGNTEPVLLLALSASPYYGLTGTVDELRMWNTARSQQQIMDNKNLELAGTEAGLVAYYRFNDGQLATDGSSTLANNGDTIQDKTASNNGALYVENASVFDEALWVSGAPVSLYDSDNDGIADACDNCPDFAVTGTVGLDFDGIDDYIEVPDADELSLLGDFTFEVWVKVTDFANFTGILGKTVSNQPAPFDYYLFSGLGTPRILVGNGSTSELVDAVNAPALGEWAHLAVVKNGTSITHYLNGIPNGTGSITTVPADNNSSMIIGSRADLFTKMKGGMDEVRVWNVARTQTQINATMHQQLTGTESGLVVYYPLNEGTPYSNNTAINTIEDISTTANNGTPVNFEKTNFFSNWTFGAPINEPDTDNDGSGDSCDLCKGDDTTGDTDMDGICDDLDPDAAAICNGDVITIQNVRYAAGVGSTSVRAGQTITTNGSVVAPPGATVTYTAGQTITLNPGFHAHVNSTFTARIAPCNPPSIAPIESRTDEVFPVISAELTLNVFPNPTKGLTTIQYNLPETGEVQLSIYDVQGRLVRTLSQTTEQSAGTHQAEWNAGDVPGGLYLIRIQTANDFKMQKLMVAKSW